jgi:cytoskeletal protein RodZ
VTAFVAGYLAEEQVVGPFNSNITEDFELDVDAAACVAPGYSLSYLYYENFQASNGGYTLSGAAPAPWQWGQPTVWPGGCAEGTNCWGTNLTGNYNHNANETLTSPLIDLSSVTPGTTLFARWYQANHIEHHQWDKAFAEVSIDGGAWQVMWQNPPSPTVIEGWRELTYDISAAAGTDAQFRWRFTSDSSVNFPGWYIDRVAIADDAGCAPAAGGLVVGNVYDDNTGSPLTGAQVANELGTVATAMATADPAVDDAFYTIFAPAGSVTLTATHTSQYSPAVANLSVANGTTQLYNFDLAAGWLVADPDEIEVTVELGSSGSTMLDLDNLGDAAVNWEISEKDEGFMPFATEQILVVRLDTTNANAMQAALDSLGYTYLGVTDTVFRTIPVSELLEYEAVFYAGAAPVDSLPFLVAYLDAGGSLLIADNDLGFFRGTTVFYQQYLQATYNADDGGNLITGEDFMAGLDLDITADPWPDDFIVGAEGVRIFKYATSNFAAGSAIERMDYRAVYLSFDVQHVAGTANRDEMISRILGFLVAGDVAWLTVTPITGTLPALGTQVVTLDFDASIAEVPEPGVYSALLRVANDTPYGRLEIPVTMNVTASPTLGLLEGVVQSQGYCDTNPFPAAGAEIVITSGANSWTRTADENGYYYIYLDESYSPVTVTANAPDHISGTATGVVLVGQQATEQDFNLRWLQPCLSTAPDSFDVELGASMTATQTLTIANAGGGVLNWAIHEANTPDTAAPEALPPSSFGRFDAAAASTAVDLVSLLGTPLPAGLSPVALPASIVDCAAEPGIIIQDDGTIENGYSGNPAAGITEVRFVDRFTPSNYPASFRAVCVAFLSLGPTSLNFDIVVYAADGPGGAPGTLLGSQAATAVTPVISPPIPPGYQPTWNSYDISAMGLQITAGSVYIGVRYTPLSPSNVFIAADESAGNPVGFAGGYWWNNSANAWVTIQSAFASYRALMVRPVEALTGCYSPSDLPWVSVSPTNGATEADSSSEVVLTFDSTGLMSGQTYSGLLCLASNDPTTPLVEIPVSLTVETSEDDGRIEGMVQSLGYCDTNPVPAVGAEVVITSGANSWTVYTDANGEYGLWLDAAHSPVDISVTAPDHTSGAALGVVIVAQQLTTVNFDLRLLEPCVSVEPAEFDVELGLGGTATYPLHIFNNGALATTFELRELPVVGYALFADLIQDGSFEAGTPNPFWDEFSTNFGTPLCDAASCGTGGGTAGPNTGAWWAWFGGSAAFEEGYVEQDVTIPVGTAELSFYFWIGTTGGPATDYFAVEMDGNEIFRVGADEQPSYSAYTLVALDISDYADGGVHTLTFYGRTGGTTTTNFNLDDVVLESTAGSLDVLWLSTDPITGTVAADSITTADVIFDTTVLTQTGVYNAFLRVLTDDPMSPAIDIPITLTVTDPEPAITLSVTVSLDDECGTADTLSVAPGSVVYYCYTVTNIGNIMLPNHTITDSVHGPMTSFVYDLMPGMSESVIISKTITADAVSTVQWMAEHPGMAMSAMAEDTVTVTVTMRYLYLPIIMKP